MDNTEQRAKLYRKIALIAGAVQSVPKDGYNPQLKYRYATPATIMEAVKPLLADQQLAIVPMVAEVVKELTGGKTQSGAEKVLTRVVMSYVILDGETGESLTCAWVGEGEDWSDKGIAKAQTIAMRTFLINLFQIPSGDEDTDPDTQPGQRQPQRPASYEPPQKAPARPAEKAHDAQKETKPPMTRADLETALQSMWIEEEERGGTIPPEEKAWAKELSKADNEQIRLLGRLSKARLVKLRKEQKQEQQPA